MIIDFTSSRFAISLNHINLKVEDRGKGRSEGGGRRRHKENGVHKSKWIRVLINDHFRNLNPVHSCTIVP